MAATKKLTNKVKFRKVFLGIFLPLILLAVVICTLFGFLSGQIARYYVRAEALRQVQAVSSDVMARLDSSIMNVETFSDYAFRNNNPSDLNLLIQSMADNMPYSESLYYATIKSRFAGGVYLDSDEDFSPQRSWEPKDYDWFQNTIKNKGEITFSPPEVDEVDGSFSITISKAVKDKSGNFVGVVATDLLLETIAEIIVDVKISENSEIYIIDKSGLFITNPDDEKIVFANYFDECALKTTSEDYFTESSGVRTTRKNFYVYSQIGNTPWYIVSEGGLKDFLAVIYKVIFSLEAISLVFSIIASLFNIRSIIRMRKDEQELGKTLFEETQNLVVAAKESAATSQDQSAAVKEIVATMEDSNALSENVSTKIKDVSKVAEKTSDDVLDGVASIEKNVAQLHAIFDANQQTIEGMKALSDKIESIWDIVTLINNVADQAKIIAFNAELEASSAGEAGKSFRIVANEIRRLSDGIIDGTKEIKEKITEVQHSSDALILASESGTEKINSGYENAKDMNNKFASIKSSAEITAKSANDITEIIQQQTIASEQILIALKQISAGIENFTVATDNISGSSEHIRQLSEELNNSVKSDESADKPKSKKEKSRG